MSNQDNVFQNIFHDKQIQSKKRLDEFLKEPGEKQIHDLRTAIRRLEAVYFILPNSCKRKKTDNFVSSYKSVFKKNSSIRDADVIIKKLLENGIPENDEIIKSIVKQKEKKLRKIIKNAKKISELKFSKPKKIGIEKITQKYEKKVYYLVKKIQKDIPIVISDESKIKELHSMRKTAKKLRYILEVEPNDSYRHLIDNMKSLQELLGMVHDCDITIDFLKIHSKKESRLSTLLEKAKEIRSEIYNKLSVSLSSKTEQ
ncbi:MAG: CHAD domain-containing protein [Nitrosopumilaceae archaeon]|jgi:CHAD domain-containing protein